MYVTHHQLRLHTVPPTQACCPQTIHADRAHAHAHAHAHSAQNNKNLLPVSKSSALPVHAPFCYCTHTQAPAPPGRLHTSGSSALGQLAMAGGATPIHTYGTYTPAAWEQLLLLFTLTTPCWTPLHAPQQTSELAWLPGHIIPPTAHPPAIEQPSCCCAEEE